MRTAPQARGERGQVLSSVVAVAAVVAIVVGLLVLFGTGGPGGGSDDKGSGDTSSGASSPALPTSPVTATTVPTTLPTSQPPRSQPTSAPTSQPPRTTRPPEPPQTSARPTAAGARPAVEVYNNTSRRGLADRVSRRAEAAGWQVAGIDNWRGKVVASTVYYPLGKRDHATALASDLGVGRVKEALGNMKKDRLTVILTSDYSG